jgi:hypothetical protein
MDVLPPEALLEAYPARIRRLAERLDAIMRRATPDALPRVRVGWRIIGYDLPVGRRSVYFAFVAPETECAPVAATGPVPDLPTRRPTADPDARDVRAGGRAGGHAARG